MKIPFGMLVDNCDPVVVPIPGLLLSGPLIGVPTSKYVTIRGAFSEPLRVNVNSVANLHRTQSLYRTGLLIEEGSLLPATLRGAVVYEEGLLCRVFSAYVTCSSFTGAAAFRLLDGTARGLVRVTQGILDAFVIGGGLAEGHDLWASLREIECLGGQRIQIHEIVPLGQAWVVPAMRMYESQDETKIVVASCGPATIDYPVAFVVSNDVVPGHVVAQQASGLVQARCGLTLSTPPALASIQWAERREPAIGVYQ
jgi:hypothetical protein